MTDSKRWVAVNGTKNDIFRPGANAVYNAVRFEDLPAPSGKWGVDPAVWSTLIHVTRQRCGQVGIMFPVNDNNLGGGCIYASVTAAKFYRHKLGYTGARVVRVGPSDHYFVIIKDGGGKLLGIADITSNQFGAPNYIVGTMSEVKGPASKVTVRGTVGTLHDAYKAGAKATDFFV